MWIIRCEMIEQAGSSVDKSDALLVSILVVVYAVKLVVHYPNEAANDETVFSKSFGAVGGFTHRFYQGENLEAEVGDFGPVGGVFARYGARVVD